MSFQSIAFACTVLIAILFGAWFLFPKEMHKVIEQLPETVRPYAEQLAFPENKRSGPQPAPTAETSDSVPEEEPTGMVPIESETMPESDKTDKEAPVDTEKSLPTTASNPDEQKTPAAQSCSVAAGKLNNFFSTLDKKDYIQAFKLKQPVRQRFESLEKKLATKTPTVVRETDDLYTVLANTAHFFRVLGQDNLQLVKTVLEQEQGNVEDLANGLYSTSTAENCPTNTVQIPFSTAYEYSVFFLNTIGGRSYLFRRAVNVRLLSTYYALLIVDQANKKNLNTHGLDISGLIPPLIREMEATNQLTHKDEYLHQLQELEAKYPARP